MAEAVGRLDEACVEVGRSRSLTVATWLVAHLQLISLGRELLAEFVGQLAAGKLRPQVRHAAGARRDPQAQKESSPGG